MSRKKIKRKKSPKGYNVERKQESVRFMITTELKDMIWDEADKKSMSASEFIRNCVYDYFYKDSYAAFIEQGIIQKELEQEQIKRHLERKEHDRKLREMIEGHRERQLKESQ